MVKSPTEETRAAAPQEIDWSTVDTVLLDMDGTLLDLHFDNYFWQEHLPQRFAEKHGIDVVTAKTRLGPRFDALRHTIQWYCTDHWSRELDMDIALLKEEVAHLIAVHPHVVEFLLAVRRSGRRCVLVTNAHQSSVSLKMRHTRLGAHLDRIISAHELGLPKENDAFWRHLHRIEPFDRATTLLIDDNLEVLRSARRFGIAHLLEVNRPDSHRSPRAGAGAEFDAIDSFRDIMPES